MIALITTLSRAGRSGLKPTPSSMNVDSRPSTQDAPGVGAVDPREALEQGALARSVASDDAEELAAGDRRTRRRERVEAVEAAAAGTDAAHAP